MAFTNAGLRLESSVRLDALGIVCDYHSDGLIFITSECLLIYANKSAEQMFGNGVCYASEKIFFDDIEATNLFLQNLKTIKDGNVSDQHLMFSVNRKSGNLPLIVMHRAMRGLRNNRDQYQNEIGPEMSVSCLIIRDPSMTGGFDQHIFGEMFSLTQTEKELAVHFLEGQNLQAFAENRSIVLDTARDHMKNLMAKCNVHRQSELMALLMASWMDVL